MGFWFTQFGVQMTKIGLLEGYEMERVGKLSLGMVSARNVWQPP